MRIKKKILIVSYIIPYPPYEGGSVRIFNLIKRISKHCEVSLISMSDRKLIKNAEFLRPFCKNIYIVPIPIVTDRNRIQKMLLFFCPREWPRLLKQFKMLLHAVPWAMSGYYHFEFRDKLREVLKNEQYDIIQFEFLQTGQYLSDVSELIRDAKTVLVEHAIQVVQLKRMLQYAQWPKKIYYAIRYCPCLMFEKNILLKFYHVIAMSELEKQKLIELGLQENRITVIRNGVDTRQYRDIEIPEAKQRIVFLGSMHFIPNRDGLVWFLDNVFPMIINKAKDATLVVIGETHSSITKQYANDHIVFRGIVERLELEMGKGMVFIAPIRIGAGTRLKILTAMAFGMPVVSASVGIEGIEAGKAEGVVIAHTEKSFADAVIELLKDNEKRCQLGNKARSFVEREYSWDVISSELVALYNFI